MKNWLMVNLFLVLACSCATSPPARFYVLGTEAPGDPPKGEARCIILGLGPIEIPSYLDRPEVVVRVGSYEVRPLDFHRWGEPLVQGISRVIADAVSKSLCVERVEHYPWKSYLSVDFQVALRVRRFEATIGERVQLVLEWVLYGQDPKKALRNGTWEIEEVLHREDVTEIVRSQSRLLEEAGRRLAREIASVSR